MAYCREVMARGRGGNDAAAFSAAALSLVLSNNGNNGNATTLRIKKARRLADENFFWSISEKKIS